MYPPLVWLSICFVVYQEHRITYGSKGVSTLIYIHHTQNMSSRFGWSTSVKVQWVHTCDGESALLCWRRSWTTTMLTVPPVPIRYISKFTCSSLKQEYVLRWMSWSPEALLIVIAQGTKASVRLFHRECHGRWKATESGAKQMWLVFSIATYTQGTYLLLWVDHWQMQPSVLLSTQFAGSLQPVDSVTVLCIVSSLRSTQCSLCVVSWKLFQRCTAFVFVRNGFPGGSMTSDG